MNIFEIKLSLKYIYYFYYIYHYYYKLLFSFFKKKKIKINFCYFTIKWSIIGNQLRIIVQSSFRFHNLLTSFH